MIIWYGERGVVNAMVTHLEQNDGAGEFLHCVKWADGSSPSWLDGLIRTKYIVEVGLAEFGNPDLILICESSADPRPFCVFIEAKVIPYSASAISNNEGMRTRGYNSACNGQLSLKYRFARALEQWDGIKDVIKEPGPLFNAYKRSISDGGLGDFHPAPRKLQKPSILKEVLAPLGLAKLPLDHFCFVALTWDREDFFKSAPEYLPKFFDESGADVFGSMPGQVGWMGYQNLEAIPGLVDAFKPALDLMVGSLEPTEIDVESATWPRLTTKSVKKMNPEIQKAMKDLDRLSRDIFGREMVQFYPGSISIKSPSRVEAKIVPRQDLEEQSILLGIRPEWPIDSWSGMKSTGYRIMDQPFRFVKLPVQEKSALEMAESVLQRLLDVLVEK